MDAQATQAATDLTDQLLKLGIGVIIGILSAILWDINSRVKELETSSVRLSELREVIKAVLYDGEHTDRRG